MIVSSKPNRPLLLFCVLLFPFFQVQAKCRIGCNLALASYYVWPGSNLTYISTIFGKTISEILRFNPDLHDPDTLISDTRINLPFSCECLNGDFLGHTFTYKTQIGDTYTKVAKVAFANLTTVDWLERVNIYGPTQIPDFGLINVTVNCSCGDVHVSRDYGLFATYPLRPGENLSSVAAEFGVSAQLLRRYNPGSDFGALVFVPVKG